MCRKSPCEDDIGFVVEFPGVKRTCRLLPTTVIIGGRTNRYFFVSNPRIWRARLRRRCDLIAQNVDDLRSLLYERVIARRELTFLQVEIVLQPDPHVATEKNCLCGDGKLVKRDSKGKPDRAWRQQVAHIDHCLRRGGLAPRNPKTNLEQTRWLDVASLNHPVWRGADGRPRILPTRA